MAHWGELAALSAAFCFTLASMFFESASKKAGSMAVNIIRLVIAFALLTVVNYFGRGQALPLDASAKAWGWLFLSGLVGFVLGDLFLFQAYVEIGSRISLLIMSAAPPLTALIGFFVLGETISPLALLGMLITMSGISLVIFGRDPQAKNIQFNRPLRGVLYASIGALGQALGLVCGKMGMGSYSPFAATQIRIIAAFIGISIVITVRSSWPEILAALKNRPALLRIAVGALFGTFIGVTCTLIAVRHAPTGVVSSLSSVSPIIIIPISIWVFKEKVSAREVLGAFVAISGVALLFL